MKRLALSIFAAALMTSAFGCSSEDIPQAHKGRMFGRTGALAFYGGTVGFYGKVLGPGTYYTGVYNEVRVVDCSQQTVKEHLESLTKDGVQFKVDVYITYSTNCSENAIEQMLGTLTPDSGHTITAKKVYETYIRPAIGEATRETVSPYRANDINDKREEILVAIRKRFLEAMQKAALVVLHNTVLSNLEYPKQLNEANVERAVQAVMKDKAVAERERVDAEVETMGKRRMLAKREGEMVAAKIDEIGAALKRNPEYLTYALQEKMPEIYRAAGEKGNLVITAPNPSVLVNPAARGK